ncbi:plasmid pRiA4b ORF-3 family protein [Gracilibacillus suaedae]|uniref:plasmid pRiA4b ORF-3 family protein n=1 Tax=Gracilibacillus suaedae TaxID=2820273 RepID=UPI001ABEBB8E|nr:plasmid pRiA4b ORF-3 family protein [Gracilibacillus suaedae]
MLIQSTKALQKYLKVDPEPKQELAFPLTGWHAHFKKIDRKNTIILVHDISLYTVVLYGVKAKDVKNFEQVVKQTIKDALIADGFDEQVVQTELLAGDLSYTSTKNRKTVSTLNQIVLEMEFFMDEADSESLLQPSLSRRVNRGLYKSISGEYVKPIEELQHVLERKAGKKAFQQPAVQLKVTLKLEGQQVWRRLVIPINRTFADLHDILQIAFNWTNSHLYEFNFYQQQPSYTDYYLPDANYTLVSHPEAFAYRKDGQEMEYAHQIVLRDVLNQYKSIVYMYDLGDDWQHFIEVEEWIDNYDARYPVCLNGEGTTPPENVGGIPGYSNFLEVIQSKDDSEREWMLNWAESMGYQPFDKDLINEQLSKIFN